MLIIALDMSKVFDCLSDSSFLVKIRTSGIGSQSSSFLTSYVCDRLQVIDINVYFFQSRAIASGVIQGNVLGSLLFLQYIHDTFKVGRHGTLCLFSMTLKFATGLFNFMLTLISENLEPLDNYCRK